jgi:hypothetical protein
MRNTSLLVFTVSALLVGVVPRARAQSFLTNGLDAYYPLAGNAIDASGNGLDGIVQGAVPTADRFGSASRACRFDGTTWIEFPDDILPLQPTELTLSVWVLPDGGPYTSQAELMDLTTRRGESGFSIMPGDPPVWSFGVHLQNAGWQEIHTPLTTNGWTHLVGTYKQGQYLQFWVNGLLMQSNLIPADSWLILPAYQLNSAIGIYDFSPGPYLGFKGAMDDLRVYRHALSAAEVQQLHQFEEISPPLPTVSLVKAVKPTFGSLIPGTAYQLQVSGDLLQWTNQGVPLTATNTTMTYPQYWEVQDWNQLFFRLRSVP